MNPYPTMADLMKAYERYEKLRKLNVPQFAELYKRNIRSEGRFDDLVDQLPGKNANQVVQQKPVTSPAPIGSEPTADEDDDGEKKWERGYRAAWNYMLLTCVGKLGRESSEAAHAAWILEREEAVRALRSVCEEHGDNDWRNDLSLGDVIEKHLGRHLDGN